MSPSLNRNNIIPSQICTVYIKEKKGPVIAPDKTFPFSAKLAARRIRPPSEHFQQITLSI